MNCTKTIAITWITRIIIFSLPKLRNTIITDCQPERFTCGFPNHEPIELRTHINIQNMSHTSATKEIKILEKILEQFGAQTRTLNNTNNWISTSIPDLITLSKHHADLCKWEWTIYKQHIGNHLIYIISSAIHRLNQLIQPNYNIGIHKRIHWHQWQHISPTNFSATSNMSQYAFDYLLIMLSFLFYFSIHIPLLIYDWMITNRYRFHGYLLVY